MENREDTLDDLGTTQDKADDILETLLHECFDDEIDLLAQALGRPSVEILDIINGDEKIDADLVMKARGIAQERNVEI